MKHDGLSKAFIVISLLFVLMIEPASELSAQASMNRNNTVDTLMQKEEKETVSAVVFPTVKGSNLSGNKFTLPEDFEGELNLVMVAFLREQQALVDTWIMPADSLEKNFDGFVYYEFPTISRLNPVSRWFINQGMRAGIPNPKARARTITLYIDKESFKRELEIPTEQTIYIFLVDRMGRLLWRSDGEYTSAKAMELEQHIVQAIGPE